MHDLSSMRRLGRSPLQTQRGGEVVEVHNLRACDVDFWVASDKTWW